MKAIITTIILATFSVSLQAKVICVAACNTSDIKSQKLLNSEALIKISDSNKNASKALDKQCPYTMDGSESEGGSIQTLGKTSCTQL